jgi:hypothetical protein
MIGRIIQIISRTDAQRASETELMPSTSLSRLASVNDVSGMNTEHSVCTHPRPSVGLDNLKIVLANAFCLLWSLSLGVLGQSKQSGF